jgi:hypothetical protein
MKLVKVVSLALLLSGLLAGFVLLNKNQNLQKSAYSGENRLLFFPESVTRSVGDTFLVYVKISPPLPGAGETAKKVTAVEFRMQYDASKLEVLPQSASAIGYALRPGTNLIGGVTATNTLFFDPDTTSVVKNTSSSGTIDFTGVSTASGGVENPGEVYVVGYYFRIKSGANTSTDLSLSSGNVGYVGSSVAEPISTSASGKTTINIKGVDPVGSVAPEPTIPSATSVPPTNPPTNCTKPSGSCSGSEVGDDNYCLNKSVSSCFGSTYTVPACSTLQFGCSDSTDPGSKLALCREQCPAGWTSVMKTISTKGDLNCKVWKCVPPAGSEPTTPPASPIPTAPVSTVVPITGVGVCRICTSEQPPRSAGNAYSVSLNACDNLINNTDYTMWAGEYFQTNGSAGVARSQQSDHWQGDFNCDGKVTLADYQLWANTIVHQ